jgi:hypothetical protein
MCLFVFFQHAFPLLAACARKYLCCPASSAPSERLFSASGNVVSYKRSTLDPHNVDKLVYIHENLNKVKLETYDYTLIPASQEEQEKGDPDPEAEPDVVEVDVEEGHQAGHRSMKAP